MRLQLILLWALLGSVALAALIATSLGYRGFFTERAPAPRAGPGVLSRSLSSIGMTEAAQQPLLVKPRLRGVSHQWACLVSIGLGIALVISAPPGRATFAAAVYAACVVALFASSATYHRINWRRPNARRWMRRLDHSAIFLLIAGSYTPFALLALDGTLADVILVIVWAGALGGIVLKLVWIDAPNWLVALIYVLLGWVAVAAAPGLVSALGHHRVGHGRARRAALHGRRRRVRAPPSRPRADRVRLPRGLSRAGDRWRPALQYAVIAFWVLPGA